MSPVGVGIILLFLGSQLLGFGLGEWFFRLFMKAMPAGATSSFNQGAAHLAFLLYGAVAGLAIFVWSLLVASLARLFGAARRAKPQPAATGPQAAPPAA